MSDMPLSEGREAGDVRVFKTGESVPADYEILAKVFASKSSRTVFSKPDEASLLKMMREPAARLGADAIIDFYSSTFNGKQQVPQYRWGSGLAVKFGAREAASQKLQSELLVAIAPPHFARKQNEKNTAKFSQLMLDAAQYYLEHKGYYAAVAQNQSDGLTIGQLDSLDFETLTNYGDARAGLICLLSLDDVSSGHALVAGGGDAQLSAKLIDKTTRTVLWENTAAGSTFSLGALFTLMQDRKKEAICAGMKNLFESLTTRAEDYRPDMATSGSRTANTGKN